ncbi:hypothetical protein Ndes2526B_g05987 [Nannochloris sp. 'desiccata']
MGAESVLWVLREQSEVSSGFSYWSNNSAHLCIKINSIGVNNKRSSTEINRRGYKRKRDCDSDSDCPMDSEMNIQDVVRVARRVYVGNLAWKTSWQDLKDFFGQVGTVKYADVLREGGPGSRSKGCGIVEFETPEEAAAAIQRLNHAELDGRQVFVREDREDFELRGEAPMALRGGEARPQRTRQRTERSTPPLGSGGVVSIGRRVWVGNLSFETSWQELKDHFKVAGHVLHADVMQDAEGRSKGCGIVEFEHPAEALRAISLLSNSTLNERQIMVREDREDPGAKGVSPIAAAGAAGGLRGGPAPDGTQLVVHGLPYRMAWQDLKDLCRAAGTVVRADVMTNPDGTSKGYGVVAFATQQDAAQGIALLNGRIVEGRVITCKYDRFAGGQ